MEGTLFNIQRFCTGDGPGIRTTVFFKGCGLKCAWCHNPESQNTYFQLKYIEPYCIKCGLCEKNCPNGVHRLCEGGVHDIQWDRCTACGACVQHCPEAALLIVGRAVDVQEVVSEVLRDRPYYGLEGGVTFSGGEPVMQATFVKEAAEQLKKEHVHIALDTCGMCDTGDLASLLPLMDLFLYDVKHMDTDMHRAYTGHGNEKILQNLKLVMEAGVPVFVRIPVIPGFNDDSKNMAETAAFLRGYDNVAVELLPYHTYGNQKYKQFGMTLPMPPFTPPTDAHMQELKEQLIKAGIRCR